MATFFLQVSGLQTPTFPCGEATCVVCQGDGGATVHGEPVEGARALARELSLTLPALDRPVGHDAPAGRLYGLDEVPRAIAALTSLLDATAGVDAPSELIEAQRNELHRAREVFEAALRHGRPVVLEV